MPNPPTLKQQKTMLVLWWLAFAIEGAAAAVHIYKYLHRPAYPRFDLAITCLVAALLFANALLRQKAYQEAQQRTAR